MRNRKTSALILAVSLVGLYGCGDSAVNLAGTWRGNINFTQASTTLQVPTVMALTQSGNIAAGTLTMTVTSGGQTRAITAAISGSVSGSGFSSTSTPSAGCTETDSASVSGNTMTFTGSATGTCTGGGYAYSGQLTR